MRCGNKFENKKKDKIRVERERRYTNRKTGTEKRNKIKRINKN